MRHKRIIVYIVSFIYAIPVALTSYINSSFLEIFLTKSEVSLAYIAASFLTIICISQLPPLLKRFGNRKLAHVFSLLVLASFLGLAFAEEARLAVVGFIVNFVTIILLYMSLDLFLEDFSKGKSLGTFRGVYLTLISSAWVLSQLVSSKIILATSFSGLYMLSSLVMIIVYIILKLTLQDFRDPKYEKSSLVHEIKLFIRKKNIGRIYLINLILKLFYAWMVIYTPIYLHDYIGFDWSQIGLIFSVMLTPFLLEFLFGKLSDKIGEKKLLKLGFFIMAASTISIPLIQDKSMLLWAGILFATRLGAAMIEVMSENYFFKSVKEEDVEALSLFRNTGPLAYILAPGLALIVFSFVPTFSYLFFVLGAIVLIGFVLTSKLKEVI